MAIVGVIVAGGKANRMGGLEKGLLDLGGRPILAHIRDRLRPQVAALALNVNREPARFAFLGLPCIGDSPGAGEGPLAGVLAALEWAGREAPAAGHVLTVPCDTPFLPESLAADLKEALRDSGAEIACAASEGRTHPLCALWPIDLAAGLRQALREEPGIGVGRWLFRYRAVEVAFPSDPVDPFLNLNAPEDLVRAAEALRFT